LRKILLVTFICLAIICAYVFIAVPMLSLFVGFSAKTSCSCHFIQGRTLDDINNDELSAVGFVKNEIDNVTNTVVSTFLTIKRYAVYKQDLGCTLVSEHEPKDIRKQSVTNLKQEFIPYEFKADSLQKPALQNVVDAAFEEPYPEKKVNTRAVLIVQNGKLLVEKYSPGYTSTTPLMGWSMTKSVINALIGILVKNKKLNIHAPVNIDNWTENSNDERNNITLDHLLRMSSGLSFEEEYNSYSDVNKMLWTKADAGAVAYNQSLEYPVDSTWAYSSGTTNIISHIIRKQFKNYESYIKFPYDSLFNKLGMSTAVMETDANGTFVGSSLMFASARDWAKVGQLFLQDGMWNNQRILPEGWVEYSHTRTHTQKNGLYAAHFWTNATSEPDDDAIFPRKWEAVPEDAYYMSGFEGQNVVIVPSLKLIVVRLGQTIDRSAWDIGQFVEKVIVALS